MIFSKTVKTTVKFIAAFSAAAILASCGDTPAKPAATPAAIPEAVAATPASICASKGAELGTLGPHAVCVFEENRQCSVEAVTAGRCIDYGYKITGYENDKQSFCAVSGHQTSVGLVNCELVSGEVCSFDDFWAGTCPA